MNVRYVESDSESRFLLQIT